MLTRRLFARFPLLACLLMLVIVLAAPTSALAKVYMVNGRDGAEGDPGDGLDYRGGGGLSNLTDNEATAGRRYIVVLVYPTRVSCLNGGTLFFSFEVRYVTSNEVFETAIRQDEIGGLP